MTWLFKQNKDFEEHLLEIPELAVRFLVKKENKTGVLDFWICSFLITPNSLMEEKPKDYFSEQLFCSGTLEEAKIMVVSYYKNYVEGILNGYI